MPAAVINPADPAMLRAAREHAGLRRETVAEALGISHSAVISYERGMCGPSAGVLVAMARLYRVSVEDLCRSAGDDLAGAR